MWLLIENGGTEAIDVFLSEDDAERALVECLRDEPQWQGLLGVQEVERRKPTRVHPYP